MRSHIQTINYSIQIGDNVIDKIAIFNQNKLPTGIAMKCIETDTFNKYLLTMSMEQYNALFLDDGELNLTNDDVPQGATEEPIPDDVIEKEVSLTGEEVSESTAE